MARIAVAGFQHETNSFAPTAATFSEFEAADAWPGLTRGGDILDAVTGMNLPIAGTIAALTAAGHEVVPLVWASASPSAAVTEDAYERITGMILDGLDAAGVVDGVYLDLHGAMIAEHAADADGETLRRVRARIGDAPLVTSLDLHGNISPQMIEIADALVAYRTYPHVDMAETGGRAAQLLMARIGGKAMARCVRPLPFLIPLPWQCSETDPARKIYARLAELEGGERTSLSFAMGFPPADVAECGPTVFAYGQTEDAVARAVAALATEIEAAEAEFAGTLWDPAAAVAHALAAAKSGGPIVLADTQDNPGGGATSDTTGLLTELVRQKAENAVLGLLCDPAAAAKAAAAGAGADIDLELGGRSGVAGEQPFAGRFRVEALGDGRIVATGPFYRGSHMQLGQMALLRLDGVRILLSSRKQQAADQAMFRHLGVAPQEAKILALKSSVHFRADFAAMAKEILVVRAPGVNVADPAELPYRNLRAGMRLNPMGPAFRPADQQSER